MTADPGPGTGPGVDSGTTVTIADLVLVRTPGQPLTALIDPLARDLARRDVPRPEETARGIIEHLLREGRL